MADTIKRDCAICEMEYDGLYGTDNICDECLEARENKNILDQLQQEAKNQNQPLEKVIHLNILDCVFDADISQISFLAQNLREQMIVDKL